MSAPAKVVDFWKDVCTTECVLCGTQRRGRGARRRWRGKYCSLACREAVRTAFREVWLRERDNFGCKRRTGQVYRAVWIPGVGAGQRNVLFDFADEVILDDGWYGEPPHRRSISQDAGEWRPIECNPGYNCTCGKPAEWVTQSRAEYGWCDGCWKRFAWVPRRRLARFLPLTLLEKLERPTLHEKAAHLGFHVIPGGKR